MENIQKIIMTILTIMLHLWSFKHTKMQFYGVLTWVLPLTMFLPFEVMVAIIEHYWHSKMSC
jgi:hypothetical protein